MICIVKQDQTGKITGWILAHDTHDARRRAQALGEAALAGALYRMEFPPSGRHELMAGVTLLVE